MKSIKKIFLLFMLVVLLTIIGGTTYGIVGGLLGFLAAIAVILIVNRAAVGFMIGQLKYNKGDHQGAYKLMRKAYDTTKLAPQFTLMYVYMMIRDGMLNEAETILNKVTYLNRRDLSKEDLMTADINKAIIMWKQNNLSGAIEQLEELYDKNLKSTTLYGALGYFYILDNQIAKGREFNKEAYEYNSENMVIADNLALNYIMNSEFEKAEELYNKLFEQNPNFIEPYYNYALMLEKRLQYDEALVYYKKALEYPEKYLSTITHSDVYKAIERLGGSVEEAAEQEQTVQEEAQEPAAQQTEQQPAEIPESESANEDDAE